MNQDQSLIESTINYYDRTAQELISKYDTAEMSTLNHILLENLIPNAKILDIGFGSGRDLDFLKNNGFEVWGVDPSKQFVDHAKKRFNNISNRFFNSSLPDLHIPRELQQSFDCIILIAVWMHLPKSTYKSSIKSLCTFLKPNGKIILSYSLTPRKEISDRHFEHIDSQLLKSLFEEHGCTQIYKSTNSDGLDNREITWITEVYNYDKL